MKSSASPHDTRAPVAVFAQHRRGDAIRRVVEFEGVATFDTQMATIDRAIGRTNLHHFAASAAHFHLAANPAIDAGAACPFLHRLRAALVVQGAARAAINAGAAGDAAGLNQCIAIGRRQMRGFAPPHTAQTFCPCTSSQMRTQRLQWMQRDISTPR